MRTWFVLLLLTFHFLFYFKIDRKVYLENIMVIIGTRWLRTNKSMPLKPPLLFMGKAKILMLEFTDSNIYWKGNTILKNLKTILSQSYLKLRFVTH